MSVTLTPSIAAPTVVGTVVTWRADVTGAQAATLWYRYRVRQFSPVSGRFHSRQAGADFDVLRDFGPVSTLDWAATEHEGTYEIDVTVMNRDTGETADAISLYEVTPAVTGAPAVNPTTNPLVVLYSAPPCPTGSRMRAQYQTGADTIQNTPFTDCNGNSTMNFLVAGLRADNTYNVWNVIDTGTQSVNGAALSFATGGAGAPDDLFTQTTLSGDSTTPGILLASTFTVPAATDLAGNLVWWTDPGVTTVTSTDGNGIFWGIFEDPSTDSSHQVIRKFDLTGRTLLETNAARVSDQLVALGKRPIGAFHHDVKTLPDGRVVAIATVEQILAGVQGPDPVDILGDMIVVLDPELNVVWAWDTFDHLDVTRAAILGEVCNTQGGACPPYYLSQSTNDWTHGNSVQLTPDGNLLYSARHQDMLYKIAYDNGQGDGSVMWRFGKDGDFTLSSSDPYPWFSHQHDANFLYSDPTQLLVFDNGNTRVTRTGSGHSRGQAFRVDEQNRTVTPILNADLGVYSVALGTAQKLPSGNYNFDAGYQTDPTGLFGGSAYSFEVDPSGKIVYAAHANDTLYRWIRLSDIYTSPD